MGFNLITLLIGLLLCFFGIYLRKLCAGIMGLAWGAISISFIIISSSGPFGIGESDITLLVCGSIACCVLCACFDRFAVSLNAFLSSLPLFTILFTLEGGFSDISGALTTSVFLSLIIAVVCYVTSNYSFVIVTAFSGAFLAAWSVYGINAEDNILDILSQIIIWGADDLMAVIFGAIALGVFGCIAQWRRIGVLKPKTEQDTGDAQNPASSSGDNAAAQETRQAPTTAFCSHCGFKDEDESVFCPMCGMMIRRPSENHSAASAGGRPNAAKPSTTPSGALNTFGAGMESWPAQAKMSYACWCLMLILSFVSFQPFWNEFFSIDFRWQIISPLALVIVSYITFSNNRKEWMVYPLALYPLCNIITLILLNTLRFNWLFLIYIAMTIVITILFYLRIKKQMDMKLVEKVSILFCIAWSIIVLIGYPLYYQAFRDIPFSFTEGFGILLSSANLETVAYLAGTAFMARNQSI